MNADEHYRAAEAHLIRAEGQLNVSGNRLLAAQVHALLALAAGGCEPAPAVTPLRSTPAPVSARGRNRRAS